MLGLEKIGNKTNYTIDLLVPWKIYQVYVTLFSKNSNIKSDVKEVLVIGESKQFLSFFSFSMIL